MVIKMEKPKKNLKEQYKKLGNWKVKRTSENQIMITVPEGLKVIGEDLTIEDLCYYEDIIYDDSHKYYENFALFNNNYTWNSKLIELHQEFWKYFLY